jgi:hypothetical protein
MNDITTIPVAAKRIGLAYSSLAQAAREGRIWPLEDGSGEGAWKVGGTWFVRVRALEEAIEAGRIRPRRKEEEK